MTCVAPPAGDSGAPLAAEDRDLLARIRHPRMRRFVEYWLAKRGARDFPARDELDPHDMRFVIGDLVIAEVHHAPLGFRYRLHGTNLVARDGYDVTGKWLDQYPEAEYRERIRRSWTLTVESRRPVLVHRSDVVDGRSRAYEVIVLPLSSDGVRIDRLISAQLYLDR